MKKISFFGLLLIAVTILFTGASLISCGGDDDNKSNPDGGGSVDGVSLVGKWRMISFDGDTDLQYEQKRRYTFNSDYTFLLEDQKSDNVNWRKRNAGTYVTDNRKLTLTTTGYYSGSDFVPYSSPEVVTVDITSISDNSLNIRTSYTEHGQTYEVTMTFVRESYTGNGGSGASNETIHGSNGGSGGYYDDGNSGGGGSSQTWVRCTYCNGTGDCHYCYGTGRCKECNGTGKRTCTVCNGLGYKYSVVTGRTTCSICNGTGKKNCIYCSSSGKCDYCYRRGNGQCAYCLGEGGRYK